MRKVLLTATVQSHIAQFHLPLIDMLHKNGYEVHVAARNNLAEKNGLKLDSPDKIYNVPFDRSPLSKNNIIAYKQLLKIINENHYDVIHCNTPMGGVLTRLAARRARKSGTKVYYTAHGFHFYKGAPLKNWIIYYPVEKWLAHYTDKLITITKEDYILSCKKLKTNTYHVHGVGVNTDKYQSFSKEEREEIRKELGYPEDSFIMLCTGELNKNKNQSTVIRAIAEVAKANRNVKLLVAGNGPMEHDLKNLMTSLNLVNNVEFLGYRTDLEKYVNVCDVVISASFREGLPLNIMEAMICKKAVVASNNRGHYELVKDKTTGVLFDPNNTNDLVNAIEYLYNNYETLKGFGENGLDAIKQYTVNNVIDELKEIYN